MFKNMHFSSNAHMSNNVSAPERSYLPSGRDRLIIGDTELLLVKCV